jgi:hypothetical protein
MMVPVAKLHIECATINPPKPLGVGIMADGKIIATCSLDELRNAVTRLHDLEMEAVGVHITRLSAEIESRKQSEREATSA